MGEERVNVPTNESRASFTRSLLEDVQALEYMLKHDWFETDTIRIGAEQEMCLVDKKTLKPTPKNMAVLKRLRDYPWATTEIARFNLESNFSPRTFTHDAFSEVRAFFVGRITTDCRVVGRAFGWRPTGVVPCPPPLSQCKPISISPPSPASGTPL